MTKLKLAPAAALVACALAAGAAGVLAQQGGSVIRNSQPDQPNQKRSSEPRGALAVDSISAPSYIRQSRTMIITRLEQERRLAQAKLDRTLKRVRSANDPEVARAKRTVDALDHLIGRIDTLLVEAVEQYPTMFDFSGGPSDPAPGPKHNKAPNSTADLSDGRQGREIHDKHEFAQARARWNRTEVQERTGIQQLEREIEQNKFELARLEVDIERLKDRVDWANTMQKKGYVSQHAFESAVREYDALSALRARLKQLLDQKERRRDAQQFQERQNQQQQAPQRQYRNQPDQQQSQQRQDKNADTQPSQEKLDRQGQQQTQNANMQSIQENFNRQGRQGQNQAQRHQHGEAGEPQSQRNTNQRRSERQTGAQTEQESWPF
jgi:hypothetical protein